ncbi:MAG: FAD-binding oxidoreductase [Actinobacteria bacterium]|nr:FAD-binding oxidoreductase [Actinomycetota bacterium]
MAAFCRACTVASVARTSDQRADAVVIGAGIIGASAALELARSGRSVVCVDLGPGPGAGSTSASSALIRFSYSTIDAVLTAWESAPYWTRWADHLGVVDPDGMAGFVRTGMLIIDEPDGIMRRVTTLWDDVGVPYERLEPDELARRVPSLDVGSFFPPKTVDDPAFGDDATARVGAVLDPNAGYVDDPLLAARNVAHAAGHHGAEFRFRERVTRVLRDEHRVLGVELASGRSVTAPVVVNAAGPHSSQLNRLADVTGDMRIGQRCLRQEVFVVPAPGEVSLEAGMPIVIDLDLGQYFRPQPGHTLLVGGTEALCDPLDWIDDPDQFDEHPTVERFETTALRLSRRVPSVGVPHRPAGLAALYDVADDWVPIYDKSNLDGWFMACATSGNQFKNAPLAGKFVRALVDAAAEGRDHDRDPVQFEGELTHRTIDLSAFSRRRDPAQTSGTVMG